MLKTRTIVRKLDREYERARELLQCYGAAKDMSTQYRLQPFVDRVEGKMEAYIEMMGMLSAIRDCDTELKLMDLENLPPAK